MRSPPPPSRSSRAAESAPCDSSRSHIAACPKRAAMCRGVAPRGPRRLTSMPCASIVRTDLADATGRWCSSRCPGCAVKVFGIIAGGEWRPSDENITGCVCAVVGDGVVLGYNMQVHLTEANDCFVVVGSGQAGFSGGGYGLFGGGGDDLMCGGDDVDYRFFGVPCCTPRRVRAALSLSVSLPLTRGAPRCCRPLARLRRRRRQRHDAGLPERQDVCQLCIGGLPLIAARRRAAAGAVVGSSKMSAHARSHAVPRPSKMISRSRIVRLKDPAGSSPVPSCTKSGWLTSASAETGSSCWLHGLSSVYTTE
mgnify:CR=1 FL=1